MMFLKGYSTSVQHMQNPKWGPQGFDVDCSFSFDTMEAAQDFMLRCQNDLDRTINRMIKIDTTHHILTCPECFKTTRILNRNIATNIGSGKGILGMCCNCDHIFTADITDEKN